MTDARLGRRVAVLVGCALAGTLFGAFGAFLQAVRATVPWAGVTLPWGAVVAVALLVVLIRIGGKVSGRSAGRWLVFAGWLAATALFALESPSGDLAISSGARQLVYLFGGVVIGAAASTVAQRGSPAPEPGSHAG